MTRICHLFLLWATAFTLATPSESLNLTVIHNNDFHTRFMPIKANNYAECEDGQSTSSDCVGGAARTVALMKKIREQSRNTLFLNAGDHFQGTFWYTIKKSEVVSEFVSLMNHDVMALGNHEFDDGPEELKAFIDKMQQQSTNFKILSCNLKIDPKSVLYGKVDNSTIKTIDGIQIAMIGYTTPDTKFLSKPGSLVTFRDEIEAIKEEIARLKQQNPTLNIFVGVGHSGFERDKEIGRAIADLDLIVGGHTNTFLFTGTELPSNEQPEGDYPYVIQHTSGEKTLIVQAFAYGKYLGKLDLVFDEQGRVAHYEGAPILIDSSFSEDEQTKKRMQEYNSALDEDIKRKIGYAMVDLGEPEECRQKECNIGNFISDSFATYFQELRTNSTFLRQRAASQCNNTLALINGGNIRSSISKGNITYKSAISALPFNNHLGVLQATGSELLALFQHSALQFKKGGFMQVSGFRVSYKVIDDNHLELDKLQVDCKKGWQSIEESTTYLVVVNDFIANGGDNYTMINIDNWTDYMNNDFEILVEYIEKMQNVSIGIEDRIHIGKSSASSRVLQMNLIAIVLIIQVFCSKSYKTG